MRSGESAKLNQWVAVAQLPFDAANYSRPSSVSVQDVLRYSVVNLNDATETLGGFPFDNATRWYTRLEQRRAAEPAGAARGPRIRPRSTEMTTRYATTGVLTRPLITLHTLRDQQVPYMHEQLYT